MGVCWDLACVHKLKHMMRKQQLSGILTLALSSEMFTPLDARPDCSSRSVSTPSPSWSMALNT